MLVTITKQNIRSYIHCVSIHHEPQYAEAAANIMARQWNHKENEKERNIKSMLEESKDKLPCHLVLLLKPTSSQGFSCDSKSTCNRTIELDSGADVVVAHVKLTRADGRGDGSCCISYSLVVAEDFRGFGIGRILTEEAENYARSLNIAYMYLSTNDKVKFYEHLNYKQCEPVSSLGNNSKRLTSTQVSSLEGLFAKRLNICNPTNCNTWLRKRLIKEYTLNEPSNIETLTNIIVKGMQIIFYDKEQLREFSHYSGAIIRLPWQQQTGPSCGIAALNMIRKYLENFQNEAQDNGAKEICKCIGQALKPIVLLNDNHSALDIALQLGISNDGELFCAYNLIYLSKRSHKLSLSVKEVTSTTYLDIYKSIQLGFPVLIPYDRSLSNHTPGCYDGKYAHWAVIVGVILPLSEDLNRNSDRFVSVNDSTKVTIVESSSRGNEQIHIIEDSCLTDDVLLVCMHGMSWKPFVCTYTDVLKSNEQLNNSKSKFYLAAEDLQHLRNKIIFVDY